MIRTTWMARSRAMRLAAQQYTMLFTMQCALVAVPLLAQAPQAPQPSSALLKERQAQLESEVVRLRSLRAQAPLDERVGITLAAHLLATGRTTDALVLHDTLLAVPRPGAPVFRYIGEFWLQVGSADSATVHLVRGTGLYSENAHLWALRAHALETASRHSEAAQAYARAATIVAEPAWLLLRAAESEQAAGDDSTARRTLERVVSRSGSGTARDIARARLSGMSAETTARNIPRTPDELRFAIREGIERVARGEEQFASQGAIGAVDADQLIDGRDLAMAWRRTRLEDDRTVLERLLRASLETTWGSVELGRLRSIYPGAALLARLDAESAMANGDLSRARREIDRLVRVAPSDPSLHVLRGRILEESSELAPARESYGRALELDASAAGAFTSLLRLHRDSGTLETLLARIQRLRTLQPGDSTLVSQEREVLHRLGRLDEARALPTTMDGRR